MNLHKKYKYANMYMGIARITANMSYCKRRKVGCVIVKDGRIISMGWNGMPAGFPNECENSDNKTRKEVLHSESNAISKLAKSLESGKNSELYSTTMPCIDCAKLIVQAGIKEVWYTNDYTNNEGKIFLETCDIKIFKLNDERCNLSYM